MIKVNLNGVDFWKGFAIGIICFEIIKTILAILIILVVMVT